MKYFLTTDTHLTDKPKDEYRFALFKQLELLMNTTSVGHLDYFFILGDLTDLKDRHSSNLCNKIVDNLLEISKTTKIIILKGNHDYINPDLPYFEFLNSIENISFITHISELELSSNDGLVRNVLLLPHTRTPEEDWNEIEPLIRKNKYDMILMHQTINGALSSNGTKMEGISKNTFKKFNGLIYSGDIHVPQKISNVEYIGSPYHVHFGDKFIPRCLLINDNAEKLKDAEIKNIYLDFPKKYSISIRNVETLKNLEDLKSGDMVKVKLTLPRSEFVSWVKYKDGVIQYCNDMGFILHGVEVVEHDKRSIVEMDKNTKKSLTNKELFNQFCDYQKVPRFERRIAEELLNDN